MIMTYIVNDYLCSYHELYNTFVIHYHCMQDQWILWMFNPAYSFNHISLQNDNSRVQSRLCTIRCNICYIYIYLL